MTDQSQTDEGHGPGRDPAGLVVVPGLPDRLRAAAEALSAVRPDGLDESELLEVLTALEATKGAAAALQARVTAQFVEQRDARVAEQRADEQISARDARCRRRSSRAEVALARRCSPGQADRHVGIAQALVHEMPQTMAALTVGAIGEWRATIMVRETACLSVEDRMEVDRRLAGDLTRLGDKELAAAAHRAAADLDAEAMVRRRRKAVASRSVSVRPAPDGMAWLSILGPMVDAVGAFAALRAAESARHVATGDPQVDAERAADERGRGAWMADTALELLSGRTAGQVQPVEVALVMGPGSLLPEGHPFARVAAHGPTCEDPACPEATCPEATCPVPTGAAGARDEVEVVGHGAWPGELAREHLLRLCDAGTATWLRRLWTTPEGRDLVAMDSARRVFGGALRRLIKLRDGGRCRVPWCGAPIRDIDHVDPVAGGGVTSAANGMGVCQLHNLVKEAGWTGAVIETGLDPGGGSHEVTLTTPTGSEYRCPAPPLLGRGRAAPTRRRAMRPDLRDSPFEVQLIAAFDAA